MSKKRKAVLPFGILGIATAIGYSAIGYDAWNPDSFAWVSYISWALAGAIFLVSVGLLIWAPGWDEVNIDLNGEARNGTRQSQNH